MTDEQRLQAFVQSVYLMRYNRYIDDITDEDGQIELNKTLDWCNQFIQDFELEADWQWLREKDTTLGTVSSTSLTIPLPSGVRKLAVAENRPVTILQDGSIVSTWHVVDADHITEDTGYYENRVTTVGDSMVFSRALTDVELGGTVQGDVIINIPELATNDIQLLDLFRPLQLLKLGIAKDATLPDIVQGGLSPSFAEKYNDLLERAVMENNAGSSAGTAQTDDLSYIGGIW